MLGRLPGAEYIDVDENPELCAEHNVMTIPLVILEDGHRLTNLSEIKKHFNL